MVGFITLKNNWMNPCVKPERKCNESVNNEFKIIWKRDSLHQIMRVSKKWSWLAVFMFVYLFFNSLFWYNEFTEARKDSLHFDSIMNPTHYESINVTWTNLKRFNLMLGENEIKFLVQHQLRVRKYRSNESVFNSKQKWNHNGMSVWL